MALKSKIKLGVLVVALVLGAAMPYLADSFIISLLSLALILGIFAMSIDLLAGYGGTVPLGQAGILAVAAYGVGYVATQQQGGFVQQVVTGFGVGMLTAAVFGLMLMRLSGIYYLMVTLAQGMILWGLAIRLTITGADNGLRGISRPPAIAAYWKYYYFCLVIAAVAGALLWVIVRSPFGLALQGMRESESRMAMLGYNIRLYKLYAFIVAGIFTSLAGVLFVYYNEFISPAAAHFQMSGRGVLMTILGGTGTLVGPMIGAVIVVFMESVVSLYVQRWPMVMGTVFILVILFARQGIVGSLSKAWRSFAERRRLHEEPRVQSLPKAQSNPPGGG